MARLYHCEDHSDGAEWDDLSYKSVVRLWESADSTDLLAVAALEVGQNYYNHEFHVERTD